MLSEYSMILLGIATLFVGQDTVGGNHPPFVENGVSVVNECIALG